MSAEKKQSTKAELFKDMDIEDYHSQTDVLSKSMLSKFADCPARFDYLYNKGGEQESSPSLELGKLVHVLALEPELYKDQYALTPDTYINDKGEEKGWRNDMRIKPVAEWHESVGDKAVISKAVLEQAQEMAKAITSDTYANALLDGDGYVEASIFFEYEGIKFRCRPDDMKNNGLINDLKITRSNKPGLFQRDAWNFGYHLSVALTTIGYEALYGKKPEDYTFICVEQEAPYIVQCYNTYSTFDPMTGLSLYDMGMFELDRLIERYKECKDADHWPAYFEGIQPLGAPGWAVKQMMEGE